jgi:urease beta subunit
MGLSTDSYTASVGTDGQFTGAITLPGQVLFFKENCIHKVYGNYPANFQLQNTTCRGVQRGSHKSLAIVNETLFYKSGNAVCAYDGSLPVEMSTALGEIRYSDAIACAYGNKYYISMKDANGQYSLFVYDMAKSMWHKEDNIRVDGVCSYMNEIYAIDHDTKHIITMLGSGTVDGRKVPWMVETGLVGMSMPDMKYISRLLIRMSLEVGANVEVSIQYDSMGDWEQVCNMTVTSLRSFSVPIRPRRCDHFRIRIEGEGEGRIYSITRTIEQGSDIS